VEQANPHIYLVAAITLSALAGGVVYALYPVSADSGYAIVRVEGGPGEMPGFMAGFKSVNAIREAVTVEGVVYEHGFIYAGEERIHYMDVVDASGRKVRIVVAPLAVEEDGVLKIVSQGRKIEMPLMMEHKVVVKGVELRNGLVVAEEILVEGMQGCMGPPNAMGHGMGAEPMGMHVEEGCGAGE
jgi:hypothetical protein